MKEFDAKTYTDGKGDFNVEDEGLLVSLLSENHDKRRILDVGCGDGQLTRRIKARFPDCRISAIDNSPEQIGMATAEESDIDFRLSDITAHSPGKDFDCVYSFYAFPHMPKSGLPDALGSVKGALREGGEFYLFTNICLFDTSVAAPEEQEACDIVFLNDWPSQINLVSLEEMRNMFREADFEEAGDRMLKTGARIKEYGNMISWLFVLR